MVITHCARSLSSFSIWTAHHAFTLAACLAAGCGGKSISPAGDGGGNGDGATATFDAAPSRDGTPPVDATGTPAPGPPSNFSATWNSDALAIDLAWDNPIADDLAGTLILRSSSGPVTETPEPGISYQVGDQLPGGSLVVHTELATSGRDERPSAGTNHYAAWSYDDYHNYSTEHVASSVTNVHSLRIDVTDPQNPTVAVIADPWPLAITEVHATLKPATALVAPHTEGEMLFSATAPGTAGNGATVALVDGGNGANLSVAVAGADVTVTFDQYAHSAAQIAQAINGDAVAAAVLTAQAPVAGMSVPPFDPVTLQGGSDTALRIHIRATNTGIRPLFNAKMMVAPASGTASSRFAVAGQPLAYFGYTGLDTGTSARGHFDLTGYSSGPDQFFVDLHVRADPSVIISGGWDSAFVAVDTSGSGAEVEISSTAVGFKPFLWDSRLRDGFITNDGRMMYLGNHNNHTIIGVDMMTYRPVVAVDLDDGSGVGHVDSVVPSPDQSYFYATVTYGAHAAARVEPGIDNKSVCGSGTCMSSAEKVELVKLKTSDLTEVGRATLFTDSTRGARGRKLRMSSDGSTGAVPIFREGRVVIVDLDNMSVLQSVDVSSVGLLPHQAAVAPDGTKTYVAFKDYAFEEGSFTDDIANDGTLQVIDHSDWSITPLVPPSPKLDALPGFLEFDLDGRLYYGRKQPDDAVAVYKPETGDWFSYPFLAGWAQGLAFARDGSRLYLWEGNSYIHVIDPSTDTRLLLLFANRGRFGHKTLVTPF